VTAADYIELSGVPESTWPTFREWYGWHADRGLVGVAKDGDKVVGVAIARCVNNGQDPKHYEHAEEGDNVFVDLTVTNTDGISNASSRKALKCLLSILWDRFGPRRRITFKRSGVYKEYDYLKFMRKAMA
jgi:hypothetical protein